MSEMPPPGMSVESTGFSSGPEPVSDQELQGRLQQLSEIAKQLKSEFIGLDGQIDLILNAIRPWYLMPEILQRPTVIGLWGRTGVGKTSLVFRLAELLGLGKRFAWEDMGKWSGDRPTTPEDLGVFEKYAGMAGQPCIFLLDELHNVNTRNPDNSEIDRPSLRDVWTVLDTGKLERDRRQVETFLMGLRDRLRSFELYQKSQPASTVPSPLDSSSLELSQWDLDMLKRYLGAHGEIDPALEQMSKNPYAYMHGVIQLMRRRIEKNPVVDFSKSLIFVAGNLDEAFVASNVSDPNWVLPDELYENSIKLTVNDMKSALLKRFRPEQVARLGSVHIPFPGFSQQQFRLLIARKLKELSDRAAKTFSIHLSFDSSVESLIFDEGVIPAQGARPVNSTINEVVESQVPIWVTAMRLAGIPETSILLRFNPLERQLYADSPKHSLHFVSEPATLQTKIRLRTKDPVHRQVVSLHEAGHAVVGIVCFGLLPKRIRYVPFHTEAEGWVEFDEVPVLNFRYALAQLAFGLGGIAAEEWVFKKDGLTLGSSWDLKKVTQMATDLIAQCGLGPHLAQSDMNFPDNATTFKPKDDRLKEQWLQAAMVQARKAISQQAPLLKAVAKELANVAIIEGEALRDLFLRHYRGSAGDKKRIANRRHPIMYETYEKAYQRFTR